MRDGSDDLSSGSWRFIGNFADEPPKRRRIRRRSLLKRTRIGVFRSFPWKGGEGNHLLIEVPTVETILRRPKGGAKLEFLNRSLPPLLALRRRLPEAALLERKECAELVRQIRGGAKDMPPVKDLILKDAYVDAARTKVLSDGSVNYVVELYDTALKETISKLKNAERLVRVKDSALNRKASEFKAGSKAKAEQSRLPQRRRPIPSSSQGEPSAERSAVPLVEGSTVPPILPSSDPGSAPLGASSIVDEEAPAREVGPGDANPVLPADGRETRPGLDDLVELSDSSIERSGQNESSDGAPPGVGEDLNASSV
ncbi:hypothetical protein Bca52824_053685 [Brassica carinata]|uniref:Uncharacterized protein n=1 Tax=Brassica carinata TaxID=52824 RepID=A0A8X7UJU7_BRACI|nr:hypothetical protein Bca52824_053685 [Brassica carinata]